MTADFAEFYEQARGPSGAPVPVPVAGVAIDLFSGKPVAGQCAPDAVIHMLLGPAGATAK